jgi:hypothetical protein
MTESHHERLTRHPTDDYARQDTLRWRITWFLRTLWAITLRFRHPRR